VRSYSRSCSLCGTAGKGDVSGQYHRGIRLFLQPGVAQAIAKPRHLGGVPDRKAIQLPDGTAIKFSVPLPEALLFREDAGAIGM